LFYKRGWPPSAAQTARAVFQLQMCRRTFIRYVVFPVMWRQTGKSLVWLRTEPRSVIHPVLEVHERIRRPQSPLEFFTGNHLPGML
jgi:hypothetical protein